MPISSNVDEENKRIILTTLVAGESGWGMYKITKKALQSHSATGGARYACLGTKCNRC